MAKNAKKKQKKIYKFLSWGLLLVSIVLIVSLLYFNILPITYQFLVMGIIALIDLILLFLMLKSKKKWFGAILSFIVMLVMLVISFYVFKTAGLLNNLNLNYKTYNYSVVVLKDSDYDKINDIENKNLGFYETDGDECEKSLEKLAKKVDTENLGYEDINTLASDLLDKKVNAILIENTYLDILDENDNEDMTNSEENSNIINFSEKTKVIYTFSIIVKTSDISKDLDVTKKPFNIYISGIDTYGEISSVSRSDVNMVVTVNPQTRQILLTSIPRDYYVKLHGKSGYNDKLTHAGLYGVDMSIQTIEDLLDIEINYYVKVNFTSVIEIVDAIGGVEVYSDYDFTSIDGYHYSKGYNKVDGKEALSFARERKAFSAGDRQRVKDQQALLEAMFRKCTSTSIITKYNSLLNSIEGSFVTNMPTDRLTALIKMQIAKKYKWTITSNSLDGENSSNYTYSYASQKLYVMEPIEESVTYATELINSVLDGEKLDPTYDGNASDVHNVTQSSSKSTSSTSSSTSNSNSTSNSSTKNNEGLKANLGKTTVTFTEGETFTYYGYTATYNGSNITNSSTVTFSINGNSYTDYHKLISYVSDLSAGEYNIVYRINYSGNNVTLNQTVIIKEAPVINTPPDDNIQGDNQENNNDIVLDNEDNIEIQN